MASTTSTRLIAKESAKGKGIYGCEIMSFTFTPPRSDARTNMAYDVLQKKSINQSSDHPLF